VDTSEAKGGEGESAFESAMTAFGEGRYGEARRQFDEVAQRGGPQAAEAALYAAQSAKNGESCAVAVSLFDQVATRYPGTRFGYDATWQAAGCYETIGDGERARRSYQALLDDPTYGDRAKSALAQLERAEPPIEVAARKKAWAAEAPSPAAAPAGKPVATTRAKAKTAASPPAQTAPQQAPPQAADVEKKSNKGSVGESF
jgi:thioredoxin-like negative regulator of GroEL